MQRRINELDSLRGVAALTVLMSHILNTFPPLPKVLLYSPLRIFWAAHEAVILFFILSGFVLTLPFLKSKTFSYPLYLAKRILRIYIPYITAIFVSLILMSLVYKMTNIETRWVQNFWKSDFIFSELYSHILMIGNFNTDFYNPVIWSLVHEMRISIVFPILVILILRINFYQSMILALFLSFVGIFIFSYGLDPSRGYLNSYAYTIHYISFFILGSLLAIHKQFINKLFNIFKFKIQILFFIVGVCIYTLQFSLDYFIQLNSLLFIKEWIIALGSIMIIITTISANWASSILSQRSIRFFGDISYSLYLYHLPFLIASFYLLNNVLPHIIIIFITLPVILFISTLSFKIIEKNSIKFSNILSKKQKSYKVNSFKKI